MQKTKKQLFDKTKYSFPIFIKHIKPILKKHEQTNTHIPNFYRAFTFILSLNLTQAQEKKVAPTSQELYNEIAAMDTVLFDAFNAKDMAKFKPLFDENLEWYQDNGGLLSYETVFSNFEKIFKNEKQIDPAIGQRQS